MSRPGDLGNPGYVTSFGDQRVATKIIHSWKGMELSWSSECKFFGVAADLPMSKKLTA